MKGEARRSGMKEERTMGIFGVVGSIALATFDACMHLVDIISNGGLLVWLTEDHCDHENARLFGTILCSLGNGEFTMSPYATADYWVSDLEKDGSEAGGYTNELADDGLYLLEWGDGFVDPVTG
jgi:hypothetical protein